ncbi:hypothetical protein F4777DRAFT_542136 [Nemania sp. FL0916]|nr:hypothetical protein F4777DRAFT_542136 [Nemania sp. FL0916]
MWLRAQYMARGCWLTVFLLAAAVSLACLCTLLTTFPSSAASLPAELGRPSIEDPSVPLPNALVNDVSPGS